MENARKLHGEKSKYICCPERDDASCEQSTIIVLSSLPFLQDKDALVSVVRYFYLHTAEHS